MYFLCKLFWIISCISVDQTKFQVVIFALFATKDYWPGFQKNQSHRTGDWNLEIGKKKKVQKPPWKQKKELWNLSNLILQL